MQPKSTPSKTTTPPRPTSPSAEEIRARLAEVEAEVERATLAMVRLWSKIHDMKKEE
jgi:hypothetical protein